MKTSEKLYLSWMVIDIILTITLFVILPFTTFLWVYGGLYVVDITLFITCPKIREAGKSVGYRAAEKITSLV